jgi:hypothetical protein
MLKILDYRVDGFKLRVRLKCSCGGRRVLKVMQDNEVHYQCAECKGMVSLASLKKEATTYWRGRNWEIECEEPKKPLEHIYVDYAACLIAQAHRYAEPFCTLTGNCIEISQSGLLFVAKDFAVKYFEGMSTENRHAVVQFTKRVHGLPPELHGSIVEIKFNEKELPLCRIRVAFENLPKDAETALAGHLTELRGRVTEWSMT